MACRFSVAALVLAAVVFTATPRPASAGDWKEYLKICSTWDREELFVWSKSGETKPDIGGSEKGFAKYVRLINEYIGDGWQPLGGPAAAFALKDILVCQAMVRN